MKRKFRITGHKPAYGAAVNAFIRACDLGVEGAFVPFSEILTATLNPDITQEQLDRQPAGIKASYEQLGCVDVTVIVLEENA